MSRLKNSLKTPNVVYLGKVFATKSTITIVKSKKRG